ncbi:RNA polymerase sigma factor [Actinoplanes flavus]|uniref:RNA polymerase sigma factor n=1 Tax=Actinoplanes flavus TaxID=2820290 RepID=A0ABS3V0I4_9ACTN|nr:RNA polymerase sigma factor [Actinoplanes flavus]MBO3744324.1 RNA polymerase sigma factor [Actinoplanes flavus]
MTIQRETLGQSGDPDDFEAVFDRYSRAVYNHAFRLTGSWSVAEDVTQSVFLTAWRRRAEVRLIDGSPLPWLLVTASHHARSEQRALTRWRNRLFRAPADEILPDPADDVAGRLDDERRMREVLAAVRGLPRAEREAVALCLWSGVPYSEAAAVLGVAESTVRSRVSRARARLSRQLAADPGPPGSIVRRREDGGAATASPEGPGSPASPTAVTSPTVITGISSGDLQPSADGTATPLIPAGTHLTSAGTHSQEES